MLSSEGLWFLPKLQRNTCDGPVWFQALKNKKHTLS